MRRYLSRKNQREKGNALMMVAIASAALTGMVATSMTKMIDTQFKAMRISTDNMRSQEYAKNAIEIVRAMPYTEITNSTFPAEKTLINGTSDYYVSYDINNDTPEPNVKTIGVSIYRGANSTTPLAKTSIERTDAMYWGRITQTAGEDPNVVISQKAASEMFALKDDVFTKDESYQIFMTQARAESLHQALEDAVADEYLTQSDAASIYRRISDSYSKGDTDSLLNALNTQVETNKNRIAANASSISNLGTRMSSAESNISTNKTNISTNKTNITTNTTNIATNKTNIATNLSSINAIKSDVTAIYSRLASAEAAFDLYLKITDAADTYLTQALADTTYQQKSTAVTHTANTAVGSATRPVYIAANGAATAGTYSFNKAEITSVSDSSQIAIWNGNTLQYVQKSKISGSGGSTCIASCTTATATAAKVATVTSGTFTLQKGVLIAVNFSNAVSRIVTSGYSTNVYYYDPNVETLNVNSSGAKTIKWNGISTAANYGCLSNGSFMFIYDGTYWVEVSGRGGSLNYYTNCNCGCFLKGTKVYCIDSFGNSFSKNIEDVKVGDKVIGANGKINAVKALFNSYIGDRRNSLYIMYKGKKFRFTGEHKLWVRQNDKEYWGVHDYNGCLAEDELLPNGKSIQQNAYEECCKKQGLEFDKILKKSKVHSDDLIMICARDLDFGRIDGWFHGHACVDREVGADEPIYQILVDGNCSFYADGFLVSSRCFAADIDWHNYVNVPDRVV